ncbi:MAG: hypothetical protein UMR38_06165 [Candidatus Izemoplasma sp.]|nr:hypothetical protein [Candidatus Izemoplasma sp.]
MEEVKDANKVVVLDEGNIVAVGSSEALRREYSFDRVKMIPKKGLVAALQKANIDYYQVNDTINIKVESSFDGIPLVKQFEEYIETFEIIRGDMDDVFLNITGRKLEGGSQ